MGAHLHLPLLGIVIGHSAPAAAARCFAANRRAVNCLYRAKGVLLLYWVSP